MYALHSNAWKGQTRSSESRDIIAKPFTDFYTPCDCSLVLRLSPRVLFRTASDGKLGGAWEQGYCDCTTFLDLKYDILSWDSVCTAYCKLCLVLMMKGSKAGLGRLQKENNHDASIRGSQEVW